MVQDVVIADSEDAKAVRGDDLTSIGVLLHLVVVDGTVDLDDEPSLGADKVDDERPERPLSPEFQPR